MRFSCIALALPSSLTYSFLLKYGKSFRRFEEKAKTTNVMETHGFLFIKILQQYRVQRRLGHRFIMQCFTIRFDVMTKFLDISRRHFPFWN